MNEYTHYFIWGYGLGLLSGGTLFFFLGRMFESWVFNRSEYKKMEDEFRKKKEERANKSL